MEDENPIAEKTSRSLLAGLLLLVIVAAAPAFAVLFNLQRELHNERVAQARAVAMQQAELLNAAGAGMVEGARQAMSAIAGATRVVQLDPECQVSLDSMRAHMAGYPVMAVLKADGSPLCVSADQPIPADAFRPLYARLRVASGFSVGGYLKLAGLTPPVLAFILPFGSPDEGTAGFVLLGLDLPHVAMVLQARHPSPVGIAILADRAGVVLAARPPEAALPGSPVPPLFQAPLQSASGPAATLTGPGGKLRVIGAVPPARNASGLFVATSFAVKDLSSGIDRAASRGYLLITLGVAVSFMLALLVGQRYLRAPATVLLGAARRWGAGDLNARVCMPAGSAAEFTDLGHAFNDMAELLRKQRTDLQTMNDVLEIRVGDRTRALLESNNRLQVAIAERELTEASLRQAQKLQVVGQLAGGIAHDFNNLLTAILGSLDLLRQDWPDSSLRHRRLFDHAAEAVSRGTRLTSQLLAFSRKQPLLLEPVNIADAIPGMMGLLTATLGASSRIETRMEEGLWPCLLDPNQFEAAILNLALNARDAMPRGGRVTLAAGNIVITPAEATPDAPPGEYVRIVMTDSGSGMSPDVQTHAFEPFFTTKPPGKASGLGLSQVHGMVLQSGGAISIESRTGAGTKITMLLPRSSAPAQPDSTQPGLTQPALTQPALTQPGLTQAGLTQAALTQAPNATAPALEPDQVILLVDDDTNVREVTETILIDNGYTVVTAADGLSALDLLERDGHHVALVIADYAMPEMTGRELLGIVRQRRPEIAVLLATGYADYGDLTGNGIELENIVRKPFRGTELLARIHRVFAHRMQPAEADAAGGS